MFAGLRGGGECGKRGAKRGERKHKSGGRDHILPCIKRLQEEDLI